VRAKEDNSDIPQTSNVSRRQFMHCVSSTAAWVRHTFISFFLLAWVAAFSVLGCGHTPEHEREKAVRTVPAPKPPLHETVPPAAGGPTHKVEDKLAVPHEEEDEWVPMTGSEQIIVDDPSLLTDGAAVKAAPAECEATQSAASTGQFDR
jgi:hypothetical protein